MKVPNRSLWLTDGFEGGAEGDWGRRVDRNISTWQARSFVLWSAMEFTHGYWLYQLCY
jgi:hypothetical protein